MTDLKLFFNKIGRLKNF